MPARARRTGDTGPRASTRYKTFLPCSLEQDGEVTRVHILNLSATGAMVATPQAMDPAQAVALQVDSGSYRANIVWAGEKRAGLRFSIPLPALTLTRLIG